MTLPTTAMRAAFLTAACATAFVFTACSSSEDTSGDDDGPPTAESFVQNRTADSTGQTVVVTFSEEVTQATAEVAARYTFSGVSAPTVTGATLGSNGTEVTLTLNAPAVPTVHTIDVAAGVEDASGETSEAVTGAALMSTDSVAPNGTAITATAVSGVRNDTIVVTFNDAMFGADVENHAYWTVESPVGTPFPITGASIEYSSASNSATVTLDDSGTAQDLHTFDSIAASFISMRDVGGNVVTSTVIGSTAIQTTVAGDTTPPTLMNVVPGVGDTLVFTFDEAVARASSGDLAATSGGVGTEFEIESIGAAAATGSFDIGAFGPTTFEAATVTLSDGTDTETFEFDAPSGFVDYSLATVLDGETVTIDDGITSVTFEFESVGGVGGGNVQVDIDGSNTNALNNLVTAVAGSALQVAQSFDGANAKEWVNLNVGGALGSVTGVGTGAYAGWFAGGVTGGNIAVATGVDNDAIAASLAAAITASTVDVTPTVRMGSANVYDLANDSNGAAGNVAMSTSAPGSITVTGMAGGVDGAALARPIASTVSADGLQVTATYTVTPAVTDTLRVYGLTDRAGNPFVPVLGQAVVAADTTEPALDAGSVAFIDAGPSNDYVAFRFVNPVHPFGADVASNFRINDGSADLDLDGATLTHTPTETRITFGADSGIDLQASEQYSIFVDGLLNEQGTPMSGADSIASMNPGGDSTAPSIVRVVDGASSWLYVEFSEAVDPVTAATASNYEISSVPATLATLVHPRVARVSFTTPPAPADVLTVSGAALIDLAGNSAGSAMAAVTAVDSTDPTVTAIDVVMDAETGEDLVTVTFSEAVDPTIAVYATSYEVSSPSTGTITISHIDADPTTNVVTLRIPDGQPLQNGEMVSVTIMNVPDTQGNVIVTDTQMTAIDTDTTAPAAPSAWIHRNVDASGATVDVVFDGRMDEASTSTSTNWSSSGAQTVTSVTRIAERHYRVELSAALGAAEMLTLTNATDRAGNVEAALQFDPVE